MASVEVSRAVQKQLGILINTANSASEYNLKHLDNRFRDNEGINTQSPESLLAFAELLLKGFWIGDKDRQTLIGPGVNAIYELMLYKAFADEVTLPVDLSDEQYFTDAGLLDLAKSTHNWNNENQIRMAAEGIYNRWLANFHKRYIRPSDYKNTSSIRELVLQKWSDFTNKIGRRTDKRANLAQDISYHIYKGTMISDYRIKSMILDPTVLENNSLWEIPHTTTK